MRWVSVNVEVKTSVNGKDSKESGYLRNLTKMTFAKLPYVS